MILGSCVVFEQEVLLSSIDRTNERTFNRSKANTSGQASDVRRGSLLPLLPLPLLPLLPLPPLPLLPLPPLPPLLLPKLYVMLTLFFKMTWPEWRNSLFHCALFRQARPVAAAAADDEISVRLNNAMTFFVRSDFSYEKRLPANLYLSDAVANGQKFEASGALRDHFF